MLKSKEWFEGTVGGDHGLVEQPLTIEQPRPCSDDISAETQRRKGTGHGSTKGKSFPGRGNIRGKGPGAGPCWACWTDLTQVLTGALWLLLGGQTIGDVGRSRGTVLVPVGDDGTRPRRTQRMGKKL